jgi:hypothetical protein
MIILILIPNVVRKVIASQEIPRYSQVNMSYSASTMQELEVANLPRSFNDVILVAVELNINYFWIDPLCIVQDGPKY